MSSKDAGLESIEVQDFGGDTGNPKPQSLNPKPQTLNPILRVVLSWAPRASFTSAVRPSLGGRSLEQAQDFGALGFIGFSLIWVLVTVL